MARRTSHAPAIAPTRKRTQISDLTAQTRMAALLACEGREVTTASRHARAAVPHQCQGAIQQSPVT